MLDLDSARLLLRRWAEEKPEVWYLALFGSRVRGTHRPDSDLDIAIGAPMEALIIEDAPWTSELEHLIGFSPVQITPQCDAAKWGLSEGCIVVYERQDTDDDSSRLIAEELDTPAIEDDDIGPVFEELRGRIKSGLRRILEIKRKHPHYAAALMIVVGCEALARLRGHKKQAVFVELLMRYKKLNTHMAEDVFDALRNGPAHVFETKCIEIDGKPPRQIEIVVSWSDHEHLSLDLGEPAHLYLNLHTMRDDLEAVFDQHREEIKALRGAQRRLPREWLDKRRSRARRSRAGWLALLAPNAD